MASVVMQAAEFPSVDLAKQAEHALRKLCDAYVDFEANDPDPWNSKRIPPPLVEFGKRHGIDWPDGHDSQFLLKGMFEDAVELIRVDRMVFFWGGGFDLGGETLREILRSKGARDVVEYCDIIIEHSDPDARVSELAEFLEYEDLGDQFSLDAGYLESVLHTVTVVGPEHSRTMSFEDSGVQDWAFVNILPQLDGEDPRLKRADI